VEGALFRPVANNRTGHLDRHLDPNSVYQNIVRKYGRETGLSAEVMGLCAHSLRATAATNALSHDADIAKVQEWLGHANVSTTFVSPSPNSTRKLQPFLRKCLHYRESRAGPTKGGKQMLKNSLHLPIGIKFHLTAGSIG
jgi:integrase